LKAIFKEEIPEPETETSYKVLINYYTSLSRYYEISLNHSKAISCFEIILNNLAKKDEMPYNYAVFLSIYSKCLLETGQPAKAIIKIDEALGLKDFYYVREQLNYLFRKYTILLFLDDQEKLNEYKDIILNFSKKNAIKLEETSEYQNYIILETYLKSDASLLLKLLPKMNLLAQWNKPQLSGEMDFATIYLLLHQPKKAIALLEKSLTPAELELQESEIDNQDLVKIYLNLAINNLESLIADINKLWELNIQKEEVLTKCFLLFNILQIISIQNVKKTHSHYLNVKLHLIEMFDKILSNHDIPFFHEFCQNQKLSIPSKIN